MQGRLNEVSEVSSDADPGNNGHAFPIFNERGVRDAGQVNGQPATPKTET